MRKIPTSSFFRALVLLLGLSFPLHAEDSLLSPLFEELSVSALEGALKTETNPLARNLLHYYLHEAHTLVGMPHRAQSHLRIATVSCALWESQDFKEFTGPALGRAAALCALVRAHSLSGNAVWEMGALARLDRSRELALKHAPSPEERLYFEGRLYMSLPAAEGRDLRKAIVALTLLEPLGRSQNARFWLARAHAMNGNRTAAENLLRPAPTVPRAARSGLEASRGLGLATPAQAALDGQGFGFTPQIFFVTGAGLGGGGTFYDDRIFDSARSARLNFSATTRGNLAASLEAAEGEWFPPVAIEAEAQWQRRYEDFFAPGIGSAGNSTTHLATRASGHVRLSRYLVEPVYLKVGWRAESDAIEVDPAVAFLPAGAPSATASTTHGPSGELGIDTRDSRRDPFVGHIARIAGYFPSRELGSRLTFEQWNFDLRSYFQPRPRQGIVLGLSAQHLGGASAPFAAYPDLSRSLAIPGTRLGRLRDRDAWGAFAEYRLSVGLSYWLAGFATVGTVAPALDRLWREPLKFGGGLALLARPLATRNVSARLEGAIFGGEFVFTAGAGAPF